MNLYKAKNKKDIHLYGVKGWKLVHIYSQGMKMAGGGGTCLAKGLKFNLCVVMVRGKNAC